MAETLGSLCDKLTIVKLKQWHSDMPERLANLAKQERQLVSEIDEYIADAGAGIIPRSSLTFAANKVYPRESNVIRQIAGSLGALVGELAKVNCDIWHEQEKVYRFEDVPVDEKDVVIKRLAVLNLERSACTEAIDRMLVDIVSKAESPLSS